MWPRGRHPTSLPSVTNCRSTSLSIQLNNRNRRMSNQRPTHCPKRIRADLIFFKKRRPQLQIPSSENLESSKPSPFLSFSSIARHSAGRRPANFPIDYSPEFSNHMTSAVLPSRHEGQWAEHKVYMRKIVNTVNPNPNRSYNPVGISRFLNQNPNHYNYNPNPRHLHNLPSRDRFRGNDEPPRRISALAPSFSSDSCNVKLESRQGGHVIFHLDSYSRSELKELKNRFVSDLERVRKYIYNIETRESEFRSTHFVRPPPIQLNNADNTTGIALPKVNKGTFAGKKKISGQKRAMLFLANGESKRPAKAAVLNSTATRKVVTAMMRKCGQILGKLMKHKHGWVFNKPVDVVTLGLHNYHAVIKHPMDLGTIKLKLGKHMYGTPLDFASDVRLTFENAMTYNPKGDDAHTMADVLLNVFEEMFNPAYEKFEAEHQRIIVAQQKLTNPLPKLAHSQVTLSQQETEKPLQIHSQAGLFKSVPPIQAGPKSSKEAESKPLYLQQQRLPELKAKESKRREMSYDERQDVGWRLQNVVAESYDQVLQIVMKRNSGLDAQVGDGEVEIDIQALDSETMWDLDEFLKLEEKAGQGRMKKEELTSESTLTLQNNNKPPVTESSIQEAVVPTIQKVDEDVDIGDEMPMNDYPPLEIERDDAPSPVRSSNSSSSSSGTNSTSSDSDSSSGSDSEDSLQSHQAS